MVKEEIIPGVGGFSQGVKLLFWLKTRKKERSGPMIKMGTVRFIFLCTGIVLGAVWEMAKVHESIVSVNQR